MDTRGIVERLQMTPRELAKWREERRRNERAGREAGPKIDIEKLLDSRGKRYWRMQSGDIIQQLGGRRQRIRGNKKGTPDYLVFVESCIGVCNASSSGEWCSQHTHILWLETKCLSGKPSKEQLEFQQKAEALGDTYLICRSAEELGKWLDSNL